MADVRIDHGVEVEVDGSRGTVGRPADVVVAGVLPPGVERGVVVGAQQLVGKPQTEAGAAQSKRPDLGVLAVAADLAVMPLVGEVSGDTRVGPGEAVLGDHRERLVPLLIARDVAVQREQ